jgi:hypothetical protein
MLDRQSWLKEADAAAARAYGEKHSGMFAWRHGAGLVGLAVALIALGLGAYWVWHHVSVPHVSAPASHGIPTAFWVVLVIAMAGTVALFRSTAAPTLFFAKLAGAVLVWLGLAAFAVAFMVA